MIKKISNIKNLAVFKNFVWDESIRDSGNNISEFKKCNIIYGRNYSGKTTLSRIFRAFETGSISDKYEDPEFSLLDTDGNTSTCAQLEDSNKIIRVFNEDFVKENLRFVHDENADINSFAILGSNNNDIETKIAELNTKLGKEEENTGLYKEYKEKSEAYDRANTNLLNAKKTLDKKLKDKATKGGFGMKYNPLFGDVNYNIKKIKDDIQCVIKETFINKSDEELIKCEKIVKEKSKPKISEVISLDLKLSNYIEQSQKLIERKIKLSEPIQELLDDSLLNQWAKKGKELHEGKRNICAFCGNEIDDSLWEKLDKHFNKESQELEETIGLLIREIKSEKVRINNFEFIKRDNFYSKFEDSVIKLETNFKQERDLYIESLNSIEKQLQSRKDAIFTSGVFIKVVDVSSDIKKIIDEYKQLSNESNNYTEQLRGEQVEACKHLRLSEVYKFIQDINYFTDINEITSLQTKIIATKKEKDEKNEELQELVKKITILRSELNDEAKGADCVNKYLNTYFGYESLSLEAIRSNEEDKQYKFQIIRNNKKAYNLSEGECSLISFCYFMARLDDINTKGRQPIIWIDDPISSLDSNHVFFIYSLINAEIVKKEDFSQLFISTHNLDFLKYLKRLSTKKKETEHFIINRKGDESSLLLMPKYLKRYVTEFNFLFQQIYKCSIANISSDSSFPCFYNFGNNLRKFLEVFLFYKYPSIEDNSKKIEWFFGADYQQISLIERITNEFSHLEEIFDRGMIPIDIPEMQTIAKFILSKIYHNDREQYNSLLKSIGVTISEEPNLTTNVDNQIIINS